MKTTKLLSWLLMLAALIIGLISCSEDTTATAPNTKGSIYGVILDAQTTALVSGAMVVIQPGGTTKTTGDDGTYSFADLTPGTKYTVTVTKTGYDKNVKEATVNTSENIKLDINITPITPTLTVTPASQNMASTGGQFIATLTSNTTWQATVNADWITLSAASGSNNSNVTVNCAANTNQSTRSGKVIFSSGNLTQEISVTQGEASTVEISPSSQPVGSQASSFAITVTANTTWQVNDNADWITLSSTGGSNNGSIVVNYATNTGVARTGMVSVTGGGVTRTCTVTQEEASALSVDPSTKDVAYQQGNFALTITANVAYNINSNQTWLSVAKKIVKNKRGQDVKTVTYTENPSTQSRLGTITITGGGVTRTCTVTQAGQPSLAVTPTIKTVDNAIGSFNLEINSNVSWSVTDDAIWLTPSVVFGQNNQMISISHTANDGALRSGTVTISGGGKTVSCVVTQLAAATLTIAPENQSVTNASGFFTLQISTNTTWQINDNLDWISFSQSSGSNNSQVTVYYTANSNANTRQGSFTVSDGNITKTCTIIQSAASSINIDPLNKTVIAAGETFSVTVTANTSWTATENESWITLGSGSGTNNGTVSVICAANPATEQRSGIVTFAGTGGSVNCLITQIANALPVVSWNSPTENTVYSIGDAPQLKVTVTDSKKAKKRSVSRVEFYYQKSGGALTKIGDGTSGANNQYTINWPTAALAYGSYTLTAKATDDFSLIGQSTVAIVLNAPPVVTITTPAEGASITQGNIAAVTATATDADGTIGEVRFYVDGVLKTTDTASPYSYDWNTTGLTVGSNHIIKAVAKDDDGKEGEKSITVNIIANTPPSVNIVGLTTGGSVEIAATTTITATASDTDGSIAEVRFYIDNVLKATDTAVPYTYDWNTTGLTLNSSHTIKVIARDNGGLEATKSITVTVTLHQMSLVEGGTFSMGNSSFATPVHSVTLSNYYIGYKEITQGQWLAVMGSNPSNFTGDLARPVERVNWYDIMVFCNKKSVLDGLTPCYTISGSTDPAVWGEVPSVRNAIWDAATCNWSAKGYRLPTEAEWEYAARGGKNSLSYTYSGSNSITEVAWYNGNSSSTTHTVGTKVANELGLYDMSGNVWEWNWDWYADYTAAAQTNPTGAANGLNRINRGGSYSLDAGYCLVAKRNADNPSIRTKIGFRLARSSSAKK